MELLQQIKSGADLQGRGQEPLSLSDESYGHVPVLLDEVLRNLVRDPGGLYVDATLGLGGHSEAILARLQGGRLLGIDLDPETLSLASTRLKSETDSFRAVSGNFRTLGQILERERFFPLNGVLFDLGISSLHFDKPSRGFSFSKEGPLDMRLSPENPLTAEAIVNRWPEEQLTMLLKEFGEEPAAQRIARAIVAARSRKPILTTVNLASLIEEMVPRTGGTHPATRTFMALRIAVNAELENLTRGLEGVLPFLRQGGRIAVISFHSLEDRIVKHLFASFVSQGVCRLLPRSHGNEPLRPTEREIKENPRSRSAKLRIVEKL